MYYKGRHVAVQDQKIEIRRIYQISGDVFDIFDHMIKINGMWHSYSTRETLDDVKKWAPKNIRIEDKR